MTTSTIESIEGIDSVNIEDIAVVNLREILKGIEKEIEKLQQDRQMIVSELERRGKEN